ncbi:MAG TPA: O-antigen ligase family protein [Patescibacteria group bacterium]|nr:O-antigen ligase family protein [Patescibacteria group bacterium]
MSKTSGQAKLTRILGYGIVIILVLMPFHAVLTTWPASHFGHFDLFRIWKDLLLVPLGLGGLYLISKDAKTRKWLNGTGLLKVIAAYIALFVLAGLVALVRHKVNASALIYALLSDLRFPVFFIICLIVATHQKWLKAHWRQLLLIPATVVIGFGLLQHYVLPANILSHVGYSPKTIVAYQTVDQKPQYVRVQSTLRGPNPLGAYLVLITTALVALLVTDKKRRGWWAALLAADVVVLFYTYSRSAWLGAALAVGLLLWWQIKKSSVRKVLLISAAAMFVLAAGTTFALRHNDRFQNTFFHTDEHSRSPDSSNFDRARALKSGLHDIVHQPWGSGPGTAGPASVRNNGQARLAENYYLQIGQEVGILGMLLFVAINILVAAALWRQGGELSLILLASLIGLTLVNLLSHAWADDTLALLWWGLAGISLGDAILNTNKHKPDEKTKKTATT